MSLILFFSRLLLYLLLVNVPLWLTPIITVSYDALSSLAWFVLVPLQMCLAYFLHPSRLVRWKITHFWLSPLLSCVTIALFVLFFSGLQKEAMLLYIVTGLLAFVSTRAVFFARVGPGIAIVEIFLFTFVYFKLLEFTRSSPEVTAQYPWLSKLLLFLLVFSFLFHAITIYLAAFPDSSLRKKRREFLTFASIVLPVILLFAFVLPNDFVKHQISFNDWNEDPPQPEQLPQQGEGGGQIQQQEQHNRNGLPLGDRNEKYPSEVQQRDQGSPSDDKIEPKTEKEERDKQKRQNQQDKQDKQDRQKRQNQQDKQDKQDRQKRQNQQDQQDKQDRQKRQNQQDQQDKQGKQDQEDNPFGGDDFMQDLPRQGQGSSSRNSSGQGGRSDGPRLEGVPAKQWDNYRNSGMEGENNKQSAIMVIASQINPVYAAESYLGDFNATDGFRISPIEHEPLNELSRLQLIETWQDRVSSRDDKRKISNMFFLSTIKRRVAAYRPYRIQPTVQNVIYHPFDLSYHVQSRVAMSQPNDWALTRDLNNEEKKRMRHYLHAKLPEKIAAAFHKHLKKSNDSYQKMKREKLADSSHREKYFDKIDAILRGFYGHRYEAGFSENTNLTSLYEFLTKNKKGDCTEFSHTAALLGRIANIPSRVVIGYLASRDLQTPAHVGGVRHLQKRIKALQDYPMKELYLITTSHYHAWVQFWIPNFGWVDFETTSFAIPPKPEFDPNQADVVIPMIEEEEVWKPSGFVFPWRLVLKLIASVGLVVLAGLYSYRYLRQIYYWLVSLGNGVQALRALQMRLLLQLAHNGYPIKGYHETILLEYAQRHENLKELQGFAELYTMLLFRENYGSGEKEQRYKQLRQAFHKNKHSLRKKDFLGRIRSIFSLRSLYY